MSDSLVDNFGRPITYLRLAVTDRCNLRCFYCMPAEGINYLPKKELLSYEEMLQLVSIFCELGITKIRVTGGEPFVRKDMIYFLEQLAKTKGLQELHITTNGVLTGQYIHKLGEIGISSVNLSLDTLNPERFIKITRKDVFKDVMDTFNQLVESKMPLKLNMVVMDSKNDADIIPMAELTKNHPISVRYIEEMPFNGDGEKDQSIYWDHINILKVLYGHYPGMVKLKDPPFSTSSNYQVSGYAGNVGIIAAYSRTFCGSCNRIRLTSEGKLKTCLYDQSRLDIKKLLRSGLPDTAVKERIVNIIGKRHRDGYAAEMARKGRIQESMSTIGG